MTYKFPDAFMVAQYLHLAPTLPDGLAITHISRPQDMNPKGILSLSPGLRGTSYPGCDRSEDSPTLKGLQHLSLMPGGRSKSVRCYNPFRVEHALGMQPRVARASQPWAEGCNPVGIEIKPVDSWVNTSSEGEGWSEGEQAIRRTAQADATLATPVTQVTYLTL